MGNKERDGFGINLVATPPAKYVKNGSDHHLLNLIKYHHLLLPYCRSSISLWRTPTGLLPHQLLTKKASHTISCVSWYFRTLYTEVIAIPRLPWFYAKSNSVLSRTSRKMVVGFFRLLNRKTTKKLGETTQQGVPWSFCDTTGYSFLSSWNERS